MGIAPRQVGVKATTNEGVDATGRREAVAAYAVCLLQYALFCQAIYA